MKIRGTPAHIAEKYLTLSRDAQTSGDPVLAENYLQHAEHYMRIIMAYRDQMQQPGDMANGHSHRLPGRGRGDEFGEDENDDILDEAFPRRSIRSPSSTSRRRANPARRRPRATATTGLSGAIRAVSAAVTGTGDRDRGGDRDRETGPGSRRSRPADGGTGSAAGTCSAAGASPGARRGRPRAAAPPRGQPRAAPGPGGEPRRERDGGGESRRRDRFQQAHEQPEFLRRPVRRARVEPRMPRHRLPRTILRRAIDAQPPLAHLKLPGAPLPWAVFS